MKVGDYVRTHGYIDKIININDFREPNMKYALEQPSWNDDVIFIGEEDITKSSPNIIDLFEEHDLVVIEYYSLRYNGRVTRLFEVAFKNDKYINLSNAKCEFMLVNGEFNKSDKELEPIIKTIVTKEQFESMEYKVGE